MPAALNNRLSEFFFSALVIFFALLCPQHFQFMALLFSLFCSLGICQGFGSCASLAVLPGHPHYRENLLLTVSMSRQYSLDCQTLQMLSTEPKISVLDSSLELSESYPRHSSSHSCVLFCFLPRRNFNSLLPASES